MVNPDTPLKVAVDPNVGTSCIIGALIIRIGFWGPLYDNYSQETPTIVWVIIEAPISLGVLGQRMRLYGSRVDMLSERGPGACYPKLFVG